MSSQRPLPRTFAASRAGLVAAALSAALLLAACSGGGSAPPQGAAPPPVPVTVLEAKPTTLPASVDVTAQTEGARDIEVRARVGGILLKRLYEEGQSVKAGQALFQLDPAPFQNALDQAKAQMMDARARSEQASREEARLKGLVAQQAVSRKEYDDAATTAAVAKAALLATEARARDAELNLSYTKVTAPIAGTAGKASRSEGALISTGADSLLTTIVQANPIRASFGLSEADIAQLPGGKLSRTTVKGVELTLPDGSVFPATGRINFAASQLDTRLGTVQLRAEFDNPDGKLLPGQYVRARVIGGERKDVFLVPQAAVMQGEMGRMLFLLGDDGKVQPRPVVAGEWRGKDWVILSGLKPGDKVIVDNLIKLRPGAPAVLKKPGEGKPGDKPGAPGAAPAPAKP